MSGTLFVVGTPIGNLEDLTFRGLRTLKEVDAIAAEDTRRTAKLLAHYEIRKPLLSLHEHNEWREAPRIVERLKRGESMALVTDAGTPGISDPGARLVAAARAADVRVVPVPGPSAVATAVSVSGFPADQFVFMGFPSRSGSKRAEWLERLQSERRLVVFFEAPHRIERTIEDVRRSLVERPILCFAELTKIHEKLVVNSSLEGSGPRSARGEFTVVIAPLASDAPSTIDENALVSIFGRITESAGFSEDFALKMLEATFDVSPSAVRKALKRHRISVERQNRHEP